MPGDRSFPESLAAKIRTVANWCREYLELQNSREVGAAFGELMGVFQEIAQLAGGGEADQFERLKELERRIDARLTALGEAHRQSLEQRHTTVDDRNASKGTVLLFVYGTLKRAHVRSHFLSAQKFVSEAVTKPLYRLFNCGDYPALVHDAGGIGIEGELWEIDSSCLARLDEVEGVPQKLYRREPVALQSPAGVGEVVSYFYLRSVRGLPDCGARWP